VNVLGEGMIFADIAEVKRAYYTNNIALHAKIKVRVQQDGKDIVVDSTVGRAILYDILPKGLPFSLVIKQ